jgi:pyruvate carboxylase subunit B
VKYFVAVNGRQVEVELEGGRVTVDGTVLQASLIPVPGTPLRQLLLGERTLVFSVESPGRGTWHLGHHGDRWEVEVVDERTRHIRGLTGEGQKRTGGGVLRAPMPGLVVRVLVEPGQPVSADAGVVVLEAMKMENQLKAPAAAVVKAVRVGPGKTVEKGEVLVEFEEERSIHPPTPP